MQAKSKDKICFCLMAAIFEASRGRKTQGAAGAGYRHAPGSGTEGVHVILQNVQRLCHGCLRHQPRATEPASGNMCLSLPSFRS